MTGKAKKLTTGQVAAVFGVTRETVRVWADEGLIPCNRTLGMGNRPGERRFDPAVVADLVKNGIKRNE